jgi:hypothetical protein
VTSRSRSYVVRHNIKKQSPARRQSSSSKSGSVTSSSSSISSQDRDEYITDMASALTSGLKKARLYDDTAFNRTSSESDVPEDNMPLLPIRHSITCGKIIRLLLRYVKIEVNQESLACVAGLMVSLRDAVSRLNGFPRLFAQALFLDFFGRAAPRSAAHRACCWSLHRQSSNPAIIGHTGPKARSQTDQSGTQ